MIAARSVALALGARALPVLLLFRLREAPIGAVRYKAQALGGPRWRFCAKRFEKVQKNLKKSATVRKNQKKSSGSKKNRPPWDPPGGPKSLLEATKLLLAMQIGGSDAFLAIYDRFFTVLGEKIKDFGRFLVGFHRHFARCLDIVVNLGTP